MIELFPLLATSLADISLSDLFNSRDQRRRPVFSFSTNPRVFVGHLLVQEGRLCINSFENNQGLDR